MKEISLLKIAGVLTFVVALFQAVITTVPSWALYFGAGEYVVSKLWLLYFAGYMVALIFVVFGIYALSGAGIIRKLPLLRTALLTIGILFTIRGSVLVFELIVNAGIIQGTKIPTQALVSSGVSMLIGIFYLWGIIKGWKSWSILTKDKL